AGPRVTAARVLVVNAGSSNLKLRLLDGDDRLAGDGDLDAPEGHGDRGELSDRLAPGGSARVVRRPRAHRGAPLQRSAPVVRRRPPRRRRGVPRRPGGLGRAAPTGALSYSGSPAAPPPAATTFPVPAPWRDARGVRRYGFHGLSHSWVSRRAAELAGRDI